MFDANTFRVRFDSENVNWLTSPEFNEMFLRTTMRYFNHLLAIKGHVFLNEVFDKLDIPRTVEGQTHGWVRFVHEGAPTLDVVSMVYCRNDDGSLDLIFQTHGDILERAFS